MADQNYDVVVIGAGPGGYVGAIRAAQLGLKTAIIEKDKTLGGTCLNVGCIPSKALLESSEKFSESLHELSKHGVKLSKVELDLDTMLKRKDKIVDDLTKGIVFLMKKNKIDVYWGRGEITGTTSVTVHKADGGKDSLTTKNIMIATGSIPVELPIAKFDGENIVSSTEALSFPEVPKHLVVVGGGVIGLELGSVWLRLGAKVTVIEASDKLCSTMDESISAEMGKTFKKQGMDIRFSTKLIKAEVVKKGQVKVSVQEAGKDVVIDCDKVLVAVGRKAFTQSLGLDSVGVKTDERGRIVVDHHLRTQVPNIFALGDVVVGPMLAHKAEEEGVAVAEIIAGKPGHVNYLTVPGIVYTWPEIASVGYTEAQVKEKGIPYKVGKFPFTPNGRARAMGYTDGFCKVIADAKTDAILGVHIIGPRAGDLLTEAVVAMEFGGSSEDLARSFHAHPTLSEVVREAALDVEKRARQM